MSSSAQTPAPPEPTTAEDYCARGAARFDANEMDGAAADFEQALRLDPDSPRGHNGRGVVALKQQRVDDALSEFELAMQLAPDFAKPYLNRATVMIEREEWIRALDDLNRSIALDPLLVLGYRHRAHCFFELKRYPEAIVDFTEWLSTHPDDGWSVIRRGLAHYYIDDHSEAINDYDSFLEIDANQAWAWSYRALAYQGLSDYDAAMSDYNRALAIDDQDAHAWYCRGALHYQLGDHEPAIADFNKALELGTQSETLLVYLGQAWYALDDFEQAIANLTKAIEINQDYYSAYYWRAKVWDSLGDAIAADADQARADKLELSSTDEENDMPDVKQSPQSLLKEHFAPTPFDQIAITERAFPVRVRTDLQRAMDQFESDGTQLVHFCGVRKRHSMEGIGFAELLTRDPHDPVTCVPPQYEEVNIGDAEPVRCLKHGLWLFSREGNKFAILLEPESQHRHRSTMRFQIAAPNDEAGTLAAQRFFKHLEQAVSESKCYRGKILSLELHDDYMGVSTGITVHKLAVVARDQVILPRTTLDLMDRNVIRFAAQRERLAALGLSTKKGLLFYGPPGTGKTHTIHYLAGALAGHTTLLISAEQVGLLGEYMTLARLLQPSIVVIEDVDLIARDRGMMHGGCEEVLLNKLLNEMDGLKPDAHILFILTTNRPEMLEAALASRPGRIDQAIEFPLPDHEGREKLMQLYACGAQMPVEVVRQAVAKTEGVSASFIKELLRRAMQFHIERSDDNMIEVADIDAALEEMLFTGGSLNRKLLGAGVADS